MNSEIKDRILKLTSQSSLARRMGRKQQTVSLWLNNDVPASKVLALCSSLNWRVTPHEVRPDLYPNQGDGLPSLTNSNGEV
ncbi:transcriptional regulator [Salmonella enterica]|nr:helix-turn-helix domain-containing protein [Salmonella enterica]